MKRFIKGAEFDLAARYQRYIAVLDDAEKLELFSDDMLAELMRCGISPTPHLMNASSEAFAPLDRMLFTDLHTYLVDDELRKIDRISMWLSLEVRVPFLDHKVCRYDSSPL